MESTMILEIIQGFSHYDLGVYKSYSRSKHSLISTKYQQAKDRISI